MELNLRNKIISIFGLNFSGKSYFVKNAILPNYKCLVFDPLKEYPHNDCDVYYPQHNVFPSIAIENEQFIKGIVAKGQYEILIYEEASRVFPNMKSLMPEMRSFFDTYRHYNNLGLVFICRRPSQLHTDIPSLSHHIVSFGSKGLPDINRLNAESEGLGTLCSQLANYEYAFVNQDRSYCKMPPI